MASLLPVDLDERVRAAVRWFWEGRGQKGTGSQAGGRGHVIGGKNLDGFGELVRDVAIHCGCPAESVIISGKKELTLPGYFRPTKQWDVLVVHQGQLLAAFELKSQVGSFGNNFNNRTEECLGSSLDLWTAFRERAFATEQGHRPGTRPFLGFLMMLEEAEGSTRGVRVDEPHFPVLPEFQGTSYVDRYRLLCEKLVAEKLYTSACLVTSPRSTDGLYTEPSSSLSTKSFFAAFAGSLMGALEAMR